MLYRYNYSNNNIIIYLPTSVTRENSQDLVLKCVIKIIWEFRVLGVVIVEGG